MNPDAELGLGGLTEDGELQLLHIDHRRYLVSVPPLFLLLRPLQQFLGLFLSVQLLYCHDLGLSEGSRGRLGLRFSDGGGVGPSCAN